MTEVIKSDQKREDFSEEKLRKSIEAAAKEANVSEERMKEVVDQVSGVVAEMVKDKNEIESSALREKILSELDSVERSVSDAWRKYDETKQSKQ